jgi:hypothetical protein
MIERRDNFRRDYWMWEIEMYQEWGTSEGVQLALLREGMRARVPEGCRETARHSESLAVCWRN